MATPDEGSSEKENKKVRHIIASTKYIIFLRCDLDSVIALNPTGYLKTDRKPKLNVKCQIYSILCLTTSLERFSDPKVSPGFLRYVRV